MGFNYVMKIKVHLLTPLVKNWSQKNINILSCAFFLFFKFGLIWFCFKNSTEIFIAFFFFFLSFCSLSGFSHMILLRNILCRFLVGVLILWQTDKCVDIPFFNYETLRISSPLWIIIKRCCSNFCCSGNVTWDCNLNW